VKRLRLGRTPRSLPLKAVCNRRLCVRVAIIGTSSGPDWAAICREPKPNPSAASNNLLEVADNFLDFEAAICSARRYADVKFSRTGLDYTLPLFISVHCLFDHRDEGRGIDSEPGKQIAHRLADGGCLRFQSLHHRRRSHIVKMLEEDRWPLRRDGIRRKRGAWKILEVVGNNHFHASSRCGSKDVAILGMVGHRGNQIFIAFDPRFREMPPNLAFSVHGLLGREAEVLLKSSGHLYHDLIGPFRQIKTWASGKPKQRVRQRHGDEDTRI